METLMEAIELPTRAVAIARPVNDPSRLLHHFLAGRSKATRIAYRSDLEDFAAFLGAETAEAGAQSLLDAGPGGANALCLDYRASLLERGLSPATVNRRLAALRSVVKLARTLGFVPFAIEVGGVKSQAYRDTRGPGSSGVRELLAELSKRTGAKGARDYAIVRLLYGAALRRNEVIGLTLGDVDLDAGTVSILGKGRTERETRTIGEPTRAALRAWITARGTEPGPLFRNFDRTERTGGLTGSGLYCIVRRLGLDAGLTLRPHGLRHAAITAALDATKGDVRAVAKFSRHRDIRTVALYDDNREDTAGKVARLVDETA